MSLILWSSEVVVNRTKASSETNWSELFRPNQALTLFYYLVYDFKHEEQDLQTCYLLCECYPINTFQGNQILLSGEWSNVRRHLTHIWLPKDHARWANSILIHAWGRWVGPTSLSRLNNIFHFPIECDVESTAPSSHKKTCIFSTH